MSKTANFFKQHIFTVLYSIELITLIVIGFFSNSFFAYDKFHSPAVLVLSLIMLSALFITAFVQDVIANREKTDVIFNALIYLGGLAWLLLSMLIGGACTLCMLIYSALLAGATAIRRILLIRKNVFQKESTKQVLAIGCLMLAAMLDLLTVAFVSEIFMAWSLIPAAVISAIALAITLYSIKDKLKVMFPNNKRRIWEVIGIILIVFAVIFAYCFTFIGISNCVFDGEPQLKQYEVLEKKARAGAKTITTFEIKTEIDGKTEWIPVSVTEYHAIEIGDTVTLRYFNGAFNIAYYVFDSVAAK